MLRDGRSAPQGYVKLTFLSHFTSTLHHDAAHLGARPQEINCVSQPQQYDRASTPDVARICLPVDSRLQQQMFMLCCRHRAYSMDTKSVWNNFSIDFLLSI